MQDGCRIVACPCAVILRSKATKDLRLLFKLRLAFHLPGTTEGRDRLARMPPKKPRSLRRVILWIFCRAWMICGLGALTTGCGFAIYRSVWLYRSVPAVGIVTGVSEATKEQDDSVNYVPTVTFKAMDGHAYRVVSSVASNPPSFEIGEEVPIRYIGSNPYSAEIDSFWQLWFVAVVCIGLGIFFAGGGYLLFRYERRSTSVL